MKKLGKIAKVVVVVFASIITFYLIWCAAGYAAMRRDVRALVAPVLNAAMANDGSNKGEDRLEDELDLVLKNQTNGGDEALAILCQYYLGEHNAEKVSIGVTRRGRRMLPYLERFQNKPGIPLRPQFLLLRLSGPERARWDGYLIGLVREGKVLEE
jgi:hypothetical protein